LHQMLEKVIERFPNLKLIVMDTFCEHFRSSEFTFSERKRTVALSLMTMQKIAAKYGVAIVFVNNMKSGKREKF
jgi:RecA/RadA recombinase